MFDLNLSARRLIVLTSCCTLVLLACGCSDDDSSRPERRAAVTLAEAESRMVEVRFDAVGNVKASLRAEISPQVDGVITGLGFEEGATVSRGQMLVQLDDSKARASVNVARAALDNAVARAVVSRQRQSRIERLFGDELVSVEELEAARADHLGAQASVRENEASLDLATRGLEEYRLLAPFDGESGYRHYDIGNFVRSGATLVVVTDSTPVEISFGVPDKHAALVKESTPVRVTVPGRSEVVQGMVNFIDPAVDSETRQLRLKAEVSNQDGLLRDGQFVELSLVLESRPDSVVVPEQAILGVGGEHWVFVVTDGKALRRSVTLGERLPGGVELRAGMEAGEQVVIAGQHRLADGDPVATGLDD